MTLQTGRYLISCVRDITKGKKLPDGVGYLNHIPEILTRVCKHPDVGDFKVIGEAFDVTCANFAVAAAKAYQEQLAKGLSEDEAQLQCGVHKAAAAKMHVLGFLFHRFCDAVMQAPAGLQGPLSDLCKLYGLNTIKENAGSFLQYGYIKPAQMNEIDNKVDHHCYSDSKLVDIGFVCSPKTAASGSHRFLGSNRLCHQFASRMP